MMQATGNHGTVRRLSSRYRRSRILAGASSVIRPPPADQQARQRRDFRHGMHDGKRDPPRIPGGSNKEQQDTNSSEVATPSLFSGRCPTVRWPGFCTDPPDDGRRCPVGRRISAPDRPRGARSRDKSPRDAGRLRGHRGHARLSTSGNPATASRKHIVGTVEGATPDPCSALRLWPGSAGVGHRQGRPHLIGQRDRDAELFLRRSDHPG